VIRIGYSCERFDPSYSKLQGKNQLEIDWIDLVWAAVTVGKLGFDDLLGYGQYSRDEVRFRYYLIRSHLMQSANKVIKSSLYRSLDSTEKGSASYFIGMAVSKIFGNSLLDVPWLVHLEKIKVLYKIELKGKSRPDLLGQNSKGQWIVFEAKGRSDGFSQSALDKAKEQAKQVKKVSGVKPFLKVAVESYFNTTLSAHIADPTESDDDGFDLEINETQFYMSYYSTISHLFQSDFRRQTVANTPYEFIMDESIGISIGIRRTILDALEGGHINREIVQDAYSYQPEPSQDAEEITKYYPDGIAIKLDKRRWGPDTMSREPSHRQ